MLNAKFPFKQFGLAGIAALTALAQPCLAEVSATIPSGSGFVVKDTNAHERFRVQDDGAVRVPGLPSATVEENLVCSDAASGQLGNCGAVAINKAAPAAGTALDVNGNVAASNVNVTGSIMVNGVSAGVPAGAVMSFAGSACPSGWLKADGALLVRANEPALFAAIGTLYGTTSADTFKVPDLRGEFVRGLDDGRGVDAGRALGSAQAQDFKSFSGYNMGPTTYSHGPVYFAKSGKNGNLYGGYWAAPAGAISIEWDASEVRPRNIALLQCIKR